MGRHGIRADAESGRKVKAASLQGAALLHCGLRPHVGILEPHGEALIRCLQINCLQNITWYQRKIFCSILLYENS